MAEAVRAVSFTLERGGAIGIVGKPGCCKSVTALSVMRPRNWSGAQTSGFGPPDMSAAFWDRRS